MRQLIVILAVAVVAGLGGWYLSRDLGGGVDGREPVRALPARGGFAGRASEPPLVVLEPVKLEVFYDSVDALGTALANESVTLTAKVTDTVRRIGFEDGDFVEVGAVLVELTNQEEEALLAEARANLEDAQSQLARLRELFGMGLTPQSELDVATSREAASRARLDTVLARLDDRLILAPFAGILGFRQVSPGTLVTPTTPITTLDDISVIKLDFTVPETFLGAMKPGARVLAQSASYAEREFEGIVRTVGSRVDPVTRAITVRAHIPNNDRALRPGMLLTTRVIMSERSSLSVPEGAVYQVQDQAYAYVVDSEMIAHEREIEIGQRRFGSVEVLSGLREGETVVSEGLVKLRDSMRVRVTEAGPEA
jgi:membrane fusion protein (multidrug efflux system)